VLLNRLESGFLLFQTPQGLVPVAPSFWQRVYLIWTFRNFRRLSLPLLNSRQAALVNKLFRIHSGVVSHNYDPWLVIGVVENFVPPAIVIDPFQAAPIEESPAIKLPESGRGCYPQLALREEGTETIAPTVVPVEASIATKIDAAPAAKAGPQIELVKEKAEIPPKTSADGSMVPRFSPLRLAWLKLDLLRLSLPRVAWPKHIWANQRWSKLRWSNPAWFKSASFNPAWSKPAWFNWAWVKRGLSKPAWAKPSWPRLASVMGALILGVLSLVAWHRIQTVPGSQAHSQPRPQSNDSVILSNFPLPAEPLIVAEKPTAPVPPTATALPPAAPETTVNSRSAPEANINLALVKRAASITAIAPHPKPEIRARGSVSAATPPVLAQERGIAATRPPLRFVYPDYAGIRARGIVALVAGVDSDGAVRTVRVVSGNRALAAAAARAVRQWRYRPYVKDGRPVATETNIVISFFSDDAMSMSFPPSIPVRR